MAILTTDPVLFQLTLSIVHFAFYLLYGSIILLLSLFDNPATQIGLVFSSFIKFVYSFTGEWKRKNYRKTNSESQIHEPDAANPLIPEKSSTKNEGIIQTAEIKPVAPLPAPSPPSPSQKVTPSTTHFKVSFCILVLIVANYISIAINIILSSVSKPQFKEISYSISEGQSQQSIDFFNSGEAVNYYHSNGNYTKADEYDNEKSTILSDDPYQYSGTLNVMLGSIFYQKNEISCGVYDTTEILAQGSSFSFPILDHAPFLPKMQCWGFIAQSTNRTYSKRYQPIYDNIYGNDMLILPQQTVSSFLHPGDNFTNIVLDQESSKLYSSTFYFEKSEQKSEIYRFQRTRYFSESRASEEVFRNFYESWIKNIVLTDGYDKNLTNPKNIPRMMNINSIGREYVHRTYLNINDGMEATKTFSWERYNFVIIFSLKSLNDNNSFVRIIFSYNRLSDNDMKLSVSKIFYRIRNVEYSVSLNPISQESNYTRPKAFFYASQWPTIEQDVLMFQPLHNVKVLPVVASSLAQYANYTLNNVEDIKYQIPDPNLYYDLAPILGVMFAIFGLSIGIYAMIFVEKKNISFPLYYDLLHESYQKHDRKIHDLYFDDPSNELKPKSTQSIFEVSRPFYVGKEFNEEIGKNSMGILDEAIYHGPPQKDSTFN